MAMNYYKSFVHINAKEWIKHIKFRFLASGVDGSYTKFLYNPYKNSTKNAPTVNPSWYYYVDASKIYEGYFQYGGYFGPDNSNDSFSFPDSGKFSTSFETQTGFNLKSIPDKTCSLNIKGNISLNGVLKKEDGSYEVKFLVQITSYKWNCNDSEVDSNIYVNFNIVAGNSYSMGDGATHEFNGSVQYKTGTDWIDIHRCFGERTVVVRPNSASSAVFIEIKSATTYNPADPHNTDYAIEIINNSIYG